MKVEEYLPAGTLVRADSGIPFDGVVVGKVTTGVDQTHLIRCTDGTIPNDTYKYDTACVPLCLLRVREEGLAEAGAILEKIKASPQTQDEISNLELLIQDYLNDNQQGYKGQDPTDVTWSLELYDGGVCVVLHGYTTETTWKHQVGDKVLTEFIDKDLLFWREY